MSAEHSTAETLVRAINWAERYSDEEPADIALMIRILLEIDVSEEEVKQALAWVRVQRYAEQGMLETSDLEAAGIACEDEHEPLRAVTVEKACDEAQHSLNRWAWDVQHRA